MKVCEANGAEVGVERFIVCIIVEFEFGGGEIATLQLQLCRACDRPFQLELVLVSGF